jgi:DegV family protein with EDD domain
MTDSVACIPDNLKKNYGIHVIPAANVYINDKAYIEGVDLTAEEAYAQIQKDPDSFVTSPPKPELIMSAYEELGKETDNIVFITIASALTAMNKTAGLAAKHYMENNPGKTVKVVDSRACASTEGLVVIAAAKAAQAGKSIDGVSDYAEAVRAKSGGLMMLDTLRYVYRTGRMSKMASRIVSMFNIRPINGVTDEGTVEMVDRARKRSEGLEKLLKLVDERTTDKSLYLMVTHAAAADMAEGLAQELKKRFNCLDMIVADYSPVMGYGAGPERSSLDFTPRSNSTEHSNGTREYHAENNRGTQQTGGAGGAGAVPRDKPGIPGYFVHPGGERIREKGLRLSLHLRAGRNTARRRNLSDSDNRLR